MTKFKCDLTFGSDWVFILTFSKQNNKTFLNSQKIFVTRTCRICIAVYRCVEWKRCDLTFCSDWVFSTKKNSQKSVFKKKNSLKFYFKKLSSSLILSYQIQIDNIFFIFFNFWRFSLFSCRNKYLSSLKCVYNWFWKNIKR